MDEKRVREAVNRLLNIIAERIVEELTKKKAKPKTTKEYGRQLARREKLADADDLKRHNAKGYQ